MFDMFASVLMGGLIKCRKKRVVNHVPNFSLSNDEVRFFLNWVDELPD